MTKKIFSGNLQKQNNISILHNDPAGIYAFPIKFVLDHYYNLSKNSFFSNSYVSFLRDTSKNTIIISNPFTFKKASDILNRLLMMIYHKRYKIH